MSTKSNETKQGFTIIEVVLVLAIAGLIFLMVFLALPALQRSQKDTQRKDQLSMMVTQIQNYQSNNKNRLPKCSGADCNIGVNADGDIVLGTTSTPSGGGESTFIPADSNTWMGFYKNYLLAGSDTFEDPNGGAYKLQIVECDSDNLKGDAGECPIQRYNLKFESSDGGNDTVPPETAASGKDEKGTGDGQNYWVLVTTKSVCDGEKVIYNAGARKVTVAYKLEGGGTFCVGN